MALPFTRRAAISSIIAGGVTTFPRNVFIPSGHAQGSAGRDWWKQAVVYQIYPRSFMDSNGDGVGDIPGVTSRLDHLAELGVDVIWLSPHYASPNVDNGYDISDYRAVNPQFGTMADFEKMVAEIRRRGMKLIVDLVVNHTSDQHTWFRQSRSGHDNPYRDFYIWRDGKDGGPPNNYTSFFGGGAWKKDNASGQYYLHYFAEQQPDLNWANPKVRAEVYDIMRFWLAKGVSGFRMDVIPFISKPENLRDLTAEELRAPEYVYANGPRIHDYLREMNREVLSYGAPMTVGEAFGVTFEQTPDFVSQRRREVDMVFHFDVVRLGRNGWRPGPWTVPQLKSTLVRDDRSAGDDGWTTSFFENHDNPRSVSVFGDNTPASAKALAVILLGRRGTPFIYQGQEIGMTNITFASIDDFADVDAKGVWRAQVLSGKEKPDTVLAALRQTSRDNARAPMQWTSGANAGFTTGTPWFRVNRNAMRINVETQRHDPDSVFLFYRRLLTLRKQHPVLVDGTFEDLDPEHPAVCAFLRQDTTARLLVLVNLTQKPQRYRLPRAAAQARVIVSTHDGATTLAPEPELQPWEAGFYTLED